MSAAIQVVDKVIFAVFPSFGRRKRAQKEYIQVWARGQITEQSQPMPRLGSDLERLTNKTVLSQLRRKF
jgi:hypothetical protein